MIPKGLQHHHFLKATEEIDLKGIPKSRESYRYDLLINGKKYPPKYVISIANKYLNSEEWSPDNFNAVEAKDYFIRNGYRILDRKDNRRISNIQTEDYSSKFPEGREKYRQHRSLERDTSIAKKAKESGTGARALRMIAENLLRDLMFEVPSDESIREILIEESTITKKTPPVIKRNGEKSA